MSPRHLAPDERRPGDRLVRVGAAVFGVGVLTVLVAVVPAVVTGDPAPTGLLVVSLVLLPVGLGLALGGLLRAARSRRRLPRTP